MKWKTILTCVLATWLLTACAWKTAGNDQDCCENRYRFATFNIAMGLDNYGDMASALKSGNDTRLEALATVLQVVRPDVVLLTEFDYDPMVEAAQLLNQNYLQVAGEGLEPVSYPYSFRPTVNTGVNSGLDLDGNGVTGEPTDAWGFGRFPGQYGMLVLSQHPFDVTQVRSFQSLRWSEFPGALRPVKENGESYYPDDVWRALRLSSKNHIDLPISLDGKTVHFLVSHPTPPVFDGPEDRNGRRNHDELALWAEYISNPQAAWLVNDQDQPGSFSANSPFIIAGDLNADPFDGDAYPGAIAQLLDHPRVDADCAPSGRGGAEASRIQAGNNLQHKGDPAEDTSDFNDETSGNYRLDYVLPSSNLNVLDCGVFWPASNEPYHQAAAFSDHRMVWLDFGW